MDAGKIKKHRISLGNPVLLTLLHRLGEGCQCGTQQAAVFYGSDGVFNLSGIQQCLQFLMEVFSKACKAVELGALNHQGATFPGSTSGMFRI